MIETTTTTNSTALAFKSHRLAIPALLSTALLACLLCPSSLQAQATFRGLGLFGESGSRATDVSADGRVVVGLSDPYLFYWTPERRITRPAPQQGHPAVSADGSIVAGIFLTPENTLEPFRWAIDIGFTPLGDLPGGLGYPSGRAFDVSANGQIVVGHGTTSAGEVAFRWTPAGMTDLGDLAGGDTASRALGVSADGSIVVGYGTGTTNSNRPQAVMWNAQGVLTPLPRPDGLRRSQANAISADGAVVVGFNEYDPAFANFAHTEAFRWTAGGGMVSLGDLPGGGIFSVANDVSADGSVIVGASATLRPDGNETQAAFYWTLRTGMVDLRQMLTNNGATNLADWRLSEATGVSADGQTIVGTGLHNGVIEAWIATIPEPPTIILAALAAAAMIGHWFHRALRRQRLDSLLSLGGTSREGD